MAAIPFHAHDRVAVDLRTRDQADPTTAHWLNSAAADLLEARAESVEFEMRTDAAHRQWAHDLFVQPGANQDHALELVGDVMNASLDQDKPRALEAGLAVGAFLAKVRRRTARQIAELDVLGQIITPNDITEPEATP